MHYGFGGFGMIIFWIVIIAVIVFLVRTLTTSSNPDKRSSRTPMEILKERYAAGDISKEEFEEKKHDLVG